VNFEEYLKSKKIDAKAFESSEPDLFNDWKVEFAQLHVNSFTLQKLNLLNPIRRKYLLQEQVSDPTVSNPPAQAKPARPMMKPKPKIN
jgi:hypothetical protein